MSTPEQSSKLIFQPLLGDEQQQQHNISAMNGSVINISTTTSSIPFGPPQVLSQPPCQWLLYAEISGSKVRIWDLIILVPNSLFLMFLIWTLKSAIIKLRSTNSPIFTAFYFLVVIAAFISVVRCLVAMTVNASVIEGDITDKVLWLVLRFFLLATELSVIVFGIAFGHLDSRTSIQRVLVITFVFALLYSCTQGTLEFLQPDPKFHVSKDSAADNFDIFAHGGMLFWITSSAFFFLIYSAIVILPRTSLRERLNLPSKKSFYYYALFLAILNLTQAVGSALLYQGVLNGMCVVDVTSYLYFTGFHPLVYGTFLRGFFRHYETVIPFSYKNQMDEGGQEDDTVSLPYQIYPKRIDYDNVSESGSFDSTHFVRGSSSLKTSSINTEVYLRGSINDSPVLYQHT